MWSKQILHLGKQFNLMICLQNVLKTSLQDVLKTPWRCLEDVFARRLRDVLKRNLKTSWRCLEDALKTSLKHLENVSKVSWRRFCETSEIILKKEQKTTKQGKQWLIKISFYLGRQYCKNFKGWEITKTLDNKQKVYVRQFYGFEIALEYKRKTLSSIWKKVLF